MKHFSSAVLNFPPLMTFRIPRKESQCHHWPTKTARQKMDRLWSAAATMEVDRSELHRPAEAIILAVRHLELSRHHRPLVAATTIARRAQDRPPPVLWASLRQVIILITHITTIITWLLTCPSRKWACITPQPPQPLLNTTRALRLCI